MTSDPYAYGCILRNSSKYQNIQQMVLRMFELLQGDPLRETVVCKQQDSFKRPPEAQRNRPWFSSGQVFVFFIYQKWPPRYPAAQCKIPATQIIFQMPLDWSAVELVVSLSMFFHVGLSQTRSLTREQINSERALTPGTSDSSAASH